MILKAKYIRTKDNIIIIFPELLQHNEFKHFEPVSAGFISICARRSDNSLHPYSECVCYGESVSLNLKANEIEDSKLAKWQILGYDRTEL